MVPRMQTTLPRLGLLIGLALSTSISNAAAATLADALSAYRGNRVAEAEALLGEIAADPAAGAAEQAGARRELGRIDWLIRGETDAAAAALANPPPGEEGCATRLMALRVYREAHEPARGLAHAASSLSECTPATAESILIERARSHLAQAELAPAHAAQHYEAAAIDLAAIEHSAHRTPLVAATRLSLALARRDAHAAFAAWHDYFWLDGEAQAPQAMTDYAARAESVFAAGLAETAVEADRVALVDMLIRAGFADDAERLAGAMSESEAWRSARAYFRFRAAIADATLRANRAMAAGNQADWYEDAIQGAMLQLMQDAGLSGDPRAALKDVYGLYGTAGETSGYPSLHGGHLVRDEQILAEQYGRRGEMRFIVIDNMLANGFESWLWDGWAEAGGWATDDGAIVQVRSAYTDGPFLALRRARPGPTRARFEAEIARAEASERAALGRDGVAELPATSDRLDLQAIDQIAARTDGDDAFIAAYGEATFDYSIRLHEGRHALDKASGRYSSTDLEFRAKLSQIALSDYPRLGLANVAGGVLADTPHGNANRRILQGYRAWMRRHHAEITGFDRNAPALSQLHLLTDEQIVTIARGLDPWARAAR